MSQRPAHSPRRTGRPLPRWVNQRMERPRRWVRWVSVWAKRISPPGFKGQSLFHVMRIWFRDVAAIDFTMRASAMAYDFFFALFPALIFLFSLLPYIPVANLAESVEQTLRNVLPRNTWDLIQPTVSNTVRQGNLWVLITSIVLLLYTSTRGMRSMIAAFYLSAPDTFRRRSFLETQWISLVLFLAIGLMFLLAMGVLIGGEFAIRALAERIHLVEDWTFVLLWLLPITVNLLLLFSVVAFLYYLAPAHAKRWSIFSPGTVLGGALLFGAQVLLRWYFGGFANYNKLYGALATVMILAVWIYYNCLVLLLGFELNTAIDAAEAHSRREQIKLQRRKRRLELARQLEEPTSTGRARRAGQQPVADLEGWSPT